jgi:16S rRNA (adenine1518-N6/adenine1519-N6)-dimethyltransferase
MNLLERTKLLLRVHRISPNKLMGQSFTVEASVFQRAIDYANLSKQDVVLDVGAGFGFLTRSLANHCKHVVAVEADETIAEVLHGLLKDLPNVEIVKGNVLKIPIPAFNKAVSIPPYQISTKLFSRLFDEDFDCAILIFQKEFANHLVAPAGSDDYSWLTVLVYYYFEAELLDKVPKWMFYPEPKVDSVIVRLTPKKPKPFIVKDEAQFKRLAQSLFTNRNRKLRNAILPYLKGMRAMTAEQAADLVGVIPFREKRVRELAPEDFGVLVNAVIT